MDATTPASSSLALDAPTSGAQPEALACGAQVMFDGACPLCRAEISIYQEAERKALASQGKLGHPGGAEATRLAWVDVSQLRPEDTGSEGAPDLAQLRARFHVRTAQGQWLSGAAAFVHLWAQLPRWRLLATLARLPGVLALMEAAYRGFLPLRPALQSLARRLSKRPPT